MRVSRKRLVLVLGLTLGFGGRAGAQSTEYRTAFVHPPRSPMIDSSPRHALPFASSMLLIQPQADFHDAYSFRITESYKIQNADNFFPFHETKTLFATESRLPLAQIWGRAVTS